MRKIYLLLIVFYGMSAASYSQNNADNIFSCSYAAKYKVYKSKIVLSFSAESYSDNKYFEKDLKKY